MFIFKLKFERAEIELAIIAFSLQLGHHFTNPGLQGRLESLNIDKGVIHGRIK